jgi:hypothetical protein
MPHAVITKVLLVTLPTNSGLTDHVSIISLNFRSPKDKGTAIISVAPNHAKTMDFTALMKIVPMLAPAQWRGKRIITNPKTSPNRRCCFLTFLKILKFILF